MSWVTTLPGLAGIAGTFLILGVGLAVAAIMWAESKRRYDQEQFEDQRREASLAEGRANQERGFKVHDFIAESVAS